MPGPTGKDAVVGRCGETCQIMRDCRNLKAATMHAVLFPARARDFSGCFNPCRAGEQRGLQEKELPGSAGGQGLH